MSERLAPRWTPGTILARAGELFRTEGPRALFCGVLAELGYRRLVLFECVPDRTRPNVGEHSVLVFGFLCEADLGEYERLRPGRRPEAEARFAAGARCYGTWLGGELVAVRWIATGTAVIPYLAASLPLRPDEAYHHDSFTAPGLRGRGIATESQSHLGEVLWAEGMRSILRAVLPENRAAIRDAVKSGYVRVGRVAVFGRRGRLVRVRRRDLA